MLSHSLCIQPWSFALPDCGLVKTDKSSLLEVIEKDVLTVSALPDNCAMVVDAMVVLQQTDVSKLSTFGDFSKCIFVKVVSTSIL